MCGNGEVLHLSSDLLASEHQCLLLTYCFRQGGQSSNTAERGHCHAVYINGPSDHVKVIRFAKFLAEGAELHTYTQCFVRQGRCKVAGATRPSYDKITVTAATPTEFRTECLRLCCHKKKIPVLHTSEVHHITVEEEQL